MFLIKKKRGEGQRGEKKGGLSQTDDQILRQPVRELESVKESDACRRTLWQPNTHSHIHTQKSCLVASEAVNHSTACEPPEGSSQQVRE